MKKLYRAKENSPYTTITAGIDDEVTTIPVAELWVFPPGPNLAVIGVGNTAETVRYADKSAGSGPGNLTGVERGFEGEAGSWDGDTQISRKITAYDFDAMRENLNDVTVLEDQVEGEALVAYDLVSLGGDGKWYKTTASDELTTGRQIGMVISAGLIQVAGKVTNPAWSLTPGARVYISESPGGITSTPGKTLIGYATSTSSLFLIPFEGAFVMIGITVFKDNFNTPVKDIPITFSAAIQTQYGITSYDWDFGDDSDHSSLLAPTHIYEEAGTYNVTLTVTDTQGNARVAHYTIHVSEHLPEDHQGILAQETPLLRHVSRLILTPNYNQITGEAGMDRASHSLQIVNT